jgi:hypothetical protein
VVGAAALVLGSAGLAHADNIATSIGAGGTTTVQLSGGVAESDVTYWVFSNNNMTGCDAADGTAAVVTVHGAGPAGLTVDTDTVTPGAQDTLEFTACGTATAGQRKPVRFRATSAGSWSITASVSDPNGQYNTNTAAFTFTAVGPSNTAPTVAVTGVADGASYEFGSVPAAACEVSDAEDGTSTHPAGLSGVTGPLSGYGLGSQTATCDHTDSGGLVAPTTTATYSIVDTTPPALIGLPSDQTVEAGPGGPAVATWFDPTASDNIDLAGSPTCAPAAGSTFPLGDTLVTCTAEDVAGNTTTGTFTVSVEDTEGPLMSPGAGNTVEATGPLTPVTFTEPTAHDVVDGPVPVTCSPASGGEFAVGDTTVTCTATDSSDNSTSVDLTVTVTDTTAPAITVPDDITEEATGPDGAAVAWEASASDLVDGDVDVTCVPAGGSTFALGVTSVSCTAEDSRGNLDSAQFTVAVHDTTAPALTVPAPISLEATGPGGAVATFTATAIDLVDHDVAVSCIPPSGSTFALGVTTVNCTAEDDSGNTDEGSFTVNVVDTTAPVLTLPADIVTTATSAAGAPVGYTASAEDLVDGAVTPSCSPASGSTFAPGTTTVTCTATDAHGNTATGTFTVTVSFHWNGFFAPVDNDGVLNIVKGGQTVPLKWNVPDGSGGWISSLDVVQSLSAVETTCSSSATVDVLEVTATGGTSLRYDATAQQYIHNWQTPKAAGNCYRVSVTLTDGSTHSALFKTK